MYRLAVFKKIGLLSKSERAMYTCEGLLLFVNNGLMSDLVSSVREAKSTMITFKWLDS